MNSQPSQTSKKSLALFLAGGLLLGIAAGWLFSDNAFSPPSPTQPAPEATQTLAALPSQPVTLPVPVTIQPEAGVPLAGETAPDFFLPSLDGETVALADFRGKVVVLNFWASWCPPCKKEMPGLQAAYDRYKDQGLVVLGINTTYLDTRQDAEQFVDELGLTFPILLDEEGHVGDRLYKVRSLPTSYWIDPQGVIQRVQIGAMTDEQIEEYAKELLPDVAGNEGPTG